MQSGALYRFKSIQVCIKTHPKQLQTSFSHFRIFPSLTIGSTERRKIRFLTHKQTRSPRHVTLTERLDLESRAMLRDRRRSEVTRALRVSTRKVAKSRFSRLQLKPAHLAPCIAWMHCPLASTAWYRLIEYFEMQRLSSYETCVQRWSDARDCTGHSTICKCTPKRG